MPAADPGRALGENPALGLLELAVPLWIEKTRGISDEQRIARARRCAQTIASHGDSLMFRDKYSAAAFNDLAEGIACAAFQPGGITVFGMHWCTARCCDCHDTGITYVDNDCGGCSGYPGILHEPACGLEPCPRGCEVPPVPGPDQGPRPVEDVELP